MTRNKLAYRKTKRFQARLDRFANGYTFIPYNNMKKKWTPYELKRLERAIQLYGRDQTKAIARYVRTRSESSCLSRLKSLISKRLITRQFNPKDDKIILALYEKFRDKDDKVLWKCMEKYMYGRSAKQIKERYKNHLAVSTADWTDAEIKYILKTKPKTTFSKIARQLKRSPHDIKRIYKRITQYIPPEEYMDESTAAEANKDGYIPPFYEKRTYPTLPDGRYYTVEDLDPSIKRFAKQYKYSSPQAQNPTNNSNSTPETTGDAEKENSHESSSDSSNAETIENDHFSPKTKDSDPSTSGVHPLSKEVLEATNELGEPVSPPTPPHTRAYPKTYTRPSKFNSQMNMFIFPTNPLFRNINVENSLHQPLNYPAMSPPSSNPLSKPKKSPKQEKEFSNVPEQSTYTLNSAKLNSSSLNASNETYKPVFLTDTKVSHSSRTYLPQTYLGSTIYTNPSQLASVPLSSYLNRTLSYDPSYSYSYPKKDQHYLANSYILPYASQVNYIPESLSQQYTQAIPKQKEVYYNPTSGYIYSNQYTYGTPLGGVPLVSYYQQQGNPANINQNTTPSNLYVPTTQSYPVNRDLLAIYSNPLNGRASPLSVSTSLSNGLHTSYLPSTSTLTAPGMKHSHKYVFNPLYNMNRKGNHMNKKQVASNTVKVGSTTAPSVSTSSPKEDKPQSGASEPNKNVLKLKHLVVQTQEEKKASSESESSLFSSDSENSSSIESQNI